MVSEARREVSAELGFDFITGKSLRLPEKYFAKANVSDDLNGKISTRKFGSFSGST
jgi:hypothetical protein